MSQTEPRPDVKEEAEPTDWARLALIVAAVVALGVIFSVSVLVIVLALVLMIFLHELGHYVTAKWAGMKVTEFFIGFGPKLWSFRKGETEYGLKAIPAGAYVRIIGMSNLEEVDPADESRTYRQKSFPRRLSVAVAGSAMHFLLAIGLVYAVLVGFGVPGTEVADDWEIGTIEPLPSGVSPAEDAGLELGDHITAVDGRRFDSYDEMRQYLRARPGEDVALLVERGGEERTLEATLAEGRDDGGRPIGQLGISAEVERVKEGAVPGLWSAVRETGETAWLSVKGIGTLFSPSGVTGYVDTLTADGEGDGSTADPSAEVRPSSIVGIVRTGGQAASEGVVAVLGFLFVINVFIGVFNLTPLLPFDGGHVAIAVYERLRSRPGRRYFADLTKLMPLTYAVVAVLALLFVSSIWLDVVRPAANPFQ